MATGDFDEWRSPNRILEVTIHRVCYPITESVLHQVFGSLGGVVDQILVTGGSDVVMTSVVFMSVEAAADAYGGLHGRNIYEGCCQMHIKWGLPIPVARGADEKASMVVPAAAPSASASVAPAAAPAPATSSLMVSASSATPTSTTAAAPSATTLVVAAAALEPSACITPSVVSTELADHYISKRGVDSSTHVHASPIQTREHEGHRKEMEVDEFIDVGLGASRPHRAPPRQPHPRRPRRAPPRLARLRRPRRGRLRLRVPRLRRPRRAPPRPPRPQRPRQAPQHVPRPRRPRQAPPRPFRPLRRRPPRPPWHAPPRAMEASKTPSTSKDAQLVFDAMLQRYITNYDSAYLIDIVLPCRDTPVEDAHKVFEELSAQNAEMLVPLLADVGDIVPWPTKVLSQITDDRAQLRPAPWPSFWQYFASVHWLHLLSLVLVDFATEAQDSGCCQMNWPYNIELFQLQPLFSANIIVPSSDVVLLHLATEVHVDSGVWKVITSQCLVMSEFLSALVISIGLWPTPIQLDLQRTVMQLSPLPWHLFSSSTIVVQWKKILSMPFCHSMNKCKLILHSVVLASSTRDFHYCTCSCSWLIAANISQPSFTSGILVVQWNRLLPMVFCAPVSNCLRKALTCEFNMECWQQWHEFLDNALQAEWFIRELVVYLFPGSYQYPVSRLVTFMWCRKFRMSVGDSKLHPSECAMPWLHEYCAYDPLSFSAQFKSGTIRLLDVLSIQSSAWNQVCQFSVHLLLVAYFMVTDSQLQRKMQFLVIGQIKCANLLLPNALFTYVHLIVWDPGGDPCSVDANTYLGMGVTLKINQVLLNLITCWRFSLCMLQFYHQVVDDP